MRIEKMLLIAALVVATGWSSLAGEAEVLYKNDFQSSEPGSLPDEFLRIDGDFAVHEENGSRFLELPGAPLETFTLLFGPSQREGFAVSARIYGTGRGRRFPTFSIGSNGVAGYKLQISPAKKQIELLRGDELRASVDHDWTSGSWTCLKLEVLKMSDQLWRVRGKVWPDGSKEPEEWSVSIEEKKEPLAGRASLWGSPFSGTPIRYDDLLVVRAGAVKK
jgi:hypothetical protein